MRAVDGAQPGPVDALGCAPPGQPAPCLPLPPLLGFDVLECLSMAGGRFGLGGGTATKCTGTLSWVFDAHFPGDPVMPGALMLDALLQLTGLYAAAAGMTGRGRAARVGAVRFLREVTPHATEIRYEIHVRRLLRAAQVVVADGAAFTGGRACLAATNLCVVVVP